MDTWVLFNIERKYGCTSNCTQKELFLANAIHSKVWKNALIFLLCLNLLFLYLLFEMTTNCRKISEQIEEKAASSDRPWISFEFFPPKTEKGVASLKNVITTLKAYKPEFMDFTWGAGGSTSELTFDLCKMTKEEFGENPNMHLTCTNMDASKIDIALESCKKAGITNILALRGDPPVGQEKWEAAEGGFKCALDLTRYIHEKYGDHFCVSVAGYPEGHPAAMTELPVEKLADLTPSEQTRFSRDEKVIKEDVDEAATERTEQVINVCLDADYKSEMEYLKAKIDAGAAMIVTQMFFDVEIYGRFVQDCREYGINVPVVPGIMCIANYGGFKRMIKFCKTRVPEALMAKMEELKDDAEAIKLFGIQFGIDMCTRMKEMGAPGFHFYTLNTSPVTVSIIEGLGYMPVTAAAEPTVFTAVTASA